MQDGYTAFAWALQGRPQEMKRNKSGPDTHVGDLHNLRESYIQLTNEDLPYGQYT
jgi:hypothetical protein